MTARFVSLSAGLELIAARSWYHAIVLLLVSTLTYGTLIPWLGYYWDDWPKAWFLHALGPTGFHEVYAIDRPYLGWTYLFTTSLIGESPGAWQVFALLTHWLSAVAVWGLLKLVWPRKLEIGVLTSLIFLVFPGFSQHATALIFGHYFLIMAIHLVALGCTILAIRRPKRQILWTLLSIVGSIYSVFSIEYFVGLELVRPLLILCVTRGHHPNRSTWIRRALRIWLPYVPVLAGFALWRVFILGFPTYELGLLARWMDQPLADSALGLIELITRDLLEVTIGSWFRLVPLPDLRSFGALTFAAYSITQVAVGFLLALYLFHRFGPSRVRPGAHEPQGSKYALLLLITGIWALLVSGWPFWLTDLPVQLAFPRDRFVLPMMLGASLVVTSGLTWLADNSARRRRIALGAACLLVALASGQQFRYLSNYRRDWVAQSDFLWQMIWRIPALEPGTAILVNELPLEFDDDESMTAAVNWIYGTEGSAPQMPYLVADVKLRLGSVVSGLNLDMPIVKPYRAARFFGSTSKVIVVAYDGQRCLRVLDLVHHDSLPGIPEPLPSALPLSKPELIQLEVPRNQELPTNVLGPEPPHRWCYFFQKAALASQRQDWQEVVRLAEAARVLGDPPNDASERLPFIEGYAHAGLWAMAIELTREMVEAQPPTLVSACRTWSRLARETLGVEGHGDALARIEQLLDCERILK